MKLGVNIDHVATVRQARRGAAPCVVAAAAAAEAGGADFITVHLREDRRHIQDADLPRIADAISTYINLEIAATDAMLAAALTFAPACVCLVPERREELTTEGGLEVVAQLPRLQEVVGALTAAGIETSLFVDPEARQVEAAAECGAPAVELHTGRYAATGDATALTAAAARARALGLKTNAGHGLNLDNVAAVRDMEFAELNIGHAIVARALFVGLTAAVQEMRAALGLSVPPACDAKRGGAA